MTEAYSKEFSELSALAEKRLQNPEVHLPHHNKLLRLWRDHSFEQHVSWVVYSPVPRFAQTDLPMAMKITWDRRFDYSRFRDPMKGLEHGLSTDPTITLRQVEFSRAELDSRLSSLESIKIPLVIDRSIHLDGEVFGFESFGEASMKFTWWSSMSDAWKPFADWATEMTSFLDAQFSLTSNNNT